MPKCEILFKNDLFFVFQNFLEYNIVSPFILQYIDQEYIPRKKHIYLMNTNAGQKTYG